MDIVAWLFTQAGGDPDTWAYKVTLALQFLVFVCPVLSVLLVMLDKRKEK